MTRGGTPQDFFPVDLTAADIAKADRGTVEQAIRNRVQTIYLGDGVMLARVLGRHKMLLHTNDRGFACHVAMDGFWEIWVTQFVARKLQPGMIAVDVGANYGYYTLLFGDAVTDSGRVLAIEPNPLASSLLRETVLLNGIADRISVVEVALGPPDLSKSHLFVPFGEPKNALRVDHDHHAGGKTISVPVRTLDALTADFARVDLVKIDAEGAEVGIIAGMQQVPRRHRPHLVLEFNAARYADARGFLDGLLALYGKVFVVGFDGTAQPVTPETILTTQVGEDWMLYFAHDSDGA